MFKAKRNRLHLIQNHELGAGAALGVPHVEGTVYDAGAVNGGGCTVIETDNAGNNYGEWVGISGTLTNCAGGPTPWGTWLTCEETETKKGGALLQDHGYVFEVFTDGTNNPKPIKAFGRYAHEALAIDKEQQHVYLSEDASGPNGLFYRWTAPAGVRLGPGLADRLGDTDGTLAAMAIIMDDGSVLPDVAYLTSAQLGRPFPVRWVTVGDRDGQAKSVRKQFADGPGHARQEVRGRLRHRRGRVRREQLRVRLRRPAGRRRQARRDGVVLLLRRRDHHPRHVLPAPADRRVDDDHGAEVRRPHLRRSRQRHRHPVGLARARRGRRGRLARAQQHAGRPDVRDRPQHAQLYSEFTGPAFSDDGRTLFVNIQTPGITLAITGPWETYLG